MVYANDFVGKTDSDIIEAAVAGKDSDGIVVIAPRNQTDDPDRSIWLLDRAVLIPENTTIILVNCTLKLSDKCRDNFFRTANCGMGIDIPKPISNVHIKGIGISTLDGADHPRATGDSSKTLAYPCPYTVEDLCEYGDWIPEERRTPEKIEFWDRHNHSVGTDINDPNESHFGDWRGIGILFAEAHGFSIENVRIVRSHGWGISLEACSNGRVEKIDFDACMSKEIDGMLQNMENQDGIDVRNGCHNIIITDITGRTGDDLIALTAVARENVPYVPGGSLRSTHVMNNDWKHRDRDIHDIIIRNVIGYSHLCLLVRLLPANTRIWNVVIDGVIDNSPEDLRPWGGILLGDGGGYGENLPDSMSDISISNVVTNHRDAIMVQGYLTNSVISNVTVRGSEKCAVVVERENGLKNVKFSNITSRRSKPFLIRGEYCDTP